jgi:hypothetical protein
MGELMTKTRASFLICATICTVIVLALTFGAVAYGSNSTQRMFSHGPVMPPDMDDNSFAHGPVMPPDMEDQSLAHGPVMPPDMEDVTFMAHGPVMPPDMEDLA